MPLPQNPTITLYFTGLLVFCFDQDNKYCQIGIHSITDDHELKLRLVKKTPDPATGSEQTLTIPHAMIRSAKNLWLNVEGTPSPKQQAKPFIAGKRNQPPVDPQDFRHVVDLEGEHFYNRRLKIKRGILKPSLFITQGVFYTASLTSQPCQVVTAANDSNHSHAHTNRSSPAHATGHSLGKIADYVGVNIYLNRSNQAIVLRAGSQSGPEMLRLKKERDTRYEITIDNGPTDHAPTGSHFGHYYDAFMLDRGEPMILIELQGKAVRADSTSVCNAIQLSKSNSM